MARVFVRRYTFTAPSHRLSKFHEFGVFIVMVERFHSKPSQVLNWVVYIKHIIHIIYMLVEPFGDPSLPLGQRLHSRSSNSDMWASWLLERGPSSLVNQQQHWFGLRVRNDPLLTSRGQKSPDLTIYFFLTTLKERKFSSDWTETQHIPII